MDLLEAEQRGFAAAVRHPWEIARLEVIKKLLARHVTLPAGAVVLDIGCGDTFVAEQLAAQYPDAFFYAIDAAFTDESMRIVRAGFTTPNVCVASSLDAVTPPIHRDVSLVILMDVLEHVADDRGFLSELLARPYVCGAVQVLATVPAYQSLFCAHDSVLGHYRRYSIRQLRAVLQQSGLRIVDSGYFFFSLLPVRLIDVMKERLLEARSDRTTGLVTWSGGATKTSLLQRLLVLDAAIGSFLRRLGLTIPGLSSYAVCRKSA